MVQSRHGFLIICALGTLAATAAGAEPLHARIDKLIADKAQGQPASPLSEDAEFVRRVYLDLAGRIPTAEETKAFLQDQASDKRAKLVDKLLDSPDYPRRMQELFHVMFMERLGDHPEWTKYLRQSFEQNKPWDQMAREILRADAQDEANRGAAFFYAKRLENFGQNPVDYPALTRDVGRLFLGKDLQCAQCHDHLFIDEYTQDDFQGLFAFFQNTMLVDAAKPAIGEKLMAQKLDYMSVFKKVPKQTGPRLPGNQEVEIPNFAKGEEYLEPPDRKTRFPGIPRFSPLASLAEQLPTAANADFSRNMVNRLWFILMGRGLVDPLDLFHSDNPPSHPELLDVLAKEFVAHRFDMKWLLRELALTETYQRSSLLPEGSAKPPAPESFLTAHEKRLSAEQLLWSMLQATGTLDSVLGPERNLTADPKDWPAAYTTLLAKFHKAFANPPREPEDTFAPSLKAALFVLNDNTVIGWLAPKSGNLVDRLLKMEAADQLADELYINILSRYPTAAEKAEVADYLGTRPERRPEAVGQLVWALLASTEFSVNH
ncbi:MAG: DUF1549 and DUF1553 domain-containing protein [Gemmataceae bacterium]